MIDHVGFPVSDYARAKAFYEKALAPLGYSVVMEVTAAQTESGAPAVGFGDRLQAGFLDRRRRRPAKAGAYRDNCEQPRGGRRVLQRGAGSRRQG